MENKTQTKALPYRNRRQIAFYKRLFYSFFEGGAVSERKVFSTDIMAPSVHTMLDWAARHGYVDCAVKSLVSKARKPTYYDLWTLTPAGVELLKRLKSRGYHVE